MNLLNNRVSTLLLSGLIAGIGFSLPAEAREDTREYKIYINGPVDHNEQYRHEKNKQQRYEKQYDKRDYGRSDHRQSAPYGRPVSPPPKAYKFATGDRRAIESYYYPKKGHGYAYGHHKPNNPHYYRYRLYEPLPAYIHYRPLPVRLEYGLPKPPRGYVRVEVGGDILLMHLATRIIFDVIRLSNY
ncbi:MULTISPECIES: hypothetical protein [Thiomicrorhabdus]|uniref:Nickel/cobalt transporter regulator n=1 Tax=Thiomicrorhabdus heinhorstiae TaxID=2748010 RepID=A0ABS0BZC5_9GAMM|nr:MULTISPECIES: hypothetical protein [Thiomicrorhabdus]MBF6057437.1 hypothetical protein [Thiomicrorhabdus heinhorstiae]